MDDYKNGNNVQLYSGETGEYEISITQILSILKHKKGWIIACFIIAVAAAFAYLKVTVPTYEASATVLVNPLSSNASSIESLLNTSSSSTNIATEVQLITAKKTLYNALDLLDLTQYKDAEGVSYSDKEFTPKNLSNMVSVSTVNSTKVVSITVKNQNQQFCADYANAVAQAYSTLLVEISKNSKSAQREFIESQIPVTEALLTQSSDALALYREESGIIQMTEKSSVLTKTIANFQMQMEPLKLQQIENQNIIETLSEQIPNAITVEQVLANEQVNKLLDVYKSSSSELIMYQNVSAEETPRVFVLESTLSSTEKDLLNVVSSMVSSGSANSSYAKAISDFICVSAQIDVLKSMEEQYNAELSQYPILERQLLEYQRDVEIYESLLLTLREMLEEVKMLEAAEVGNVTIVDSAIVPINPVSPRKMMIMAVSAIAGIVIGAGIAILYDFLDDSIKSEDTIKQIIGKNFPSLGWTVYVKDLEKIKVTYPRLFVFNAPESSVAERYRSISNNIVYSTPKKIQVLSINSTDMAEGKTTAICNIAASYALVGKKVLIVDGDFRKPAVESFFNLKRSKLGFVDSIIKDVPLEKCIVRPVAAIPNLHILPPGRGTRNPNALYNSEKFDIVFEKLRKVYDYVIIDCPPLSYGSEFTHLAKHLDGFVLNIRAGVASKSAVAEFAKNLEFIKAPLLGYIYYGVVSKNQSHHGSYGRYGSYGYSYGGSKKYGYGGKYGYYSKNGQDDLYVEGTGSYRKIYKGELKRRKEDSYGKMEPILAFANGSDKAFSSISDEEETTTQKASAAVKPVVKPVTVAKAEEKKAEDITSDMLSQIEKDYSKKS